MRLLYRSRDWKKTLDPCPICGDGVHVYWGANCVEIFGDYVYEDIARKAEKMGGTVTFFAHNGKGYDFHFILRDIFRKNFISTDIMMSGNKIIHLSVGNVSFVDSLLFFGQSLASLPKALGLDRLESKGFFPHNFNKPENWLYSGPYPDQKFYQPDLMKLEVNEEFESWYSKIMRNNETFNFKDQIIKYCLNDVEILTTCCLIFRAKFLSLNGLDPFTQCFTIAQVGLVGQLAHSTWEKVF